MRSYPTQKHLETLRQRTKARRPFLLSSVTRAHWLVRRAALALVVLMLTLIITPQPASATHWFDMEGTLTDVGWISYGHKRCNNENGIVWFQHRDGGTASIRTYYHGASPVVGGTAYIVRSWAPGEHHTSNMGVPKGRCFYWNTRKSGNCSDGSCYLATWTGYIWYTLDGVTKADT